jgi:hypothetical protein
MTREERAAIEKRIFLLEQMTVENGATQPEEATAQRKIQDLKQKIEDDLSLDEKERKLTREQKIKESRDLFHRFMADLNNDYEKYNMEQHKIKIVNRG